MYLWFSVRVSGANDNANRQCGHRTANWERRHCAAKGSAFGIRKPLKRLDRNFWLWIHKLIARERTYQLQYERAERATTRIDSAGTAPRIACAGSAPRIDSAGTAPRRRNFWILQLSLHSIKNYPYFVFVFSKNCTNITKIIIVKIYSLSKKYMLKITKKVFF